MTLPKLNPGRLKFLYLAMNVVLFATCFFFVQTGNTQIISQEQVWQEVQKVAPQYDLDPAFVWNIIYAESSFNARAETHVARGLMQLTSGAWQEVASEVSYNEAWNWRINIRVGCAYLKQCKDRLERSGNFSYSHLAAAYHYGLSRVQGANFNLASFRDNPNHIYRELLAGNISPRQPPQT